MLAEMVDGDHWRIAKDVAITVHAEPRKREYNTMIGGDLPDGFQDSGVATNKENFQEWGCKNKRNG